MQSRQKPGAGAAVAIEPHLVRRRIRSFLHLGMARVFLISGRGAGGQSAGRFPPQDDLAFCRAGGVWECEFTTFPASAGPAALVAPLAFWGVWAGAILQTATARHRVAGGSFMSTVGRGSSAADAGDAYPRTTMRTGRLLAPSIPVNNSTLPARTPQPSCRIR